MARCTAWGKYLVTYSRALTVGDESQRAPSPKRQRLHLLYILNDVLYHLKYRANASICAVFQPVLADLFGYAAAFTSCPKHLGKLLDLLAIWEQHGYYETDFLEMLRQVVRSASETGTYEQEIDRAGSDGLDGGKVALDPPYTMPGMHGDVATPWYDLPAGNYMAHIIPNSTKPIKPDMIQPLQFLAGPAEPKLVDAVKSLLHDAEVIYGEGANDEDVNFNAMDMNELGQRVASGNSSSEGYYGWSQSFCERMKQRREGGKRRYSGESDESESRRRASASRSRSRTPDRLEGSTRQSFATLPPASHRPVAAPLGNFPPPPLPGNAWPSPGPGNGHMMSWQPPPPPPPPPPPLSSFPAPPFPFPPHWGPPRLE